MAKYHVNDAGQAGPCGATKGACPFGGDDAHYANADEARKAYEAKMAEQVVPNGQSKAGLGARELNDLAKTSTDREVLSEIVARGSSRAYKNLAKNPSVPSDIIEQAYLGAHDEATRSALAKNPNVPVRVLTTEDFAALAASENASHSRRVATDDSVDDERLQAAIDAGAKWAVVDALRNPYNRLSQQKVTELAETSWMNMGYATKSDRYPASRIKDLPKSLVYWGNIDGTSNPAYLDGYADWAIGQKDVDEHNASYYAERVAMNPETSAETLSKLAQADLALPAVYKHPRATDEVRSLAAFKSPEVESLAKLDSLQERFGGKLKEELTYVENTNHPFGRNRGISDTMVRFNTEKMAELGLESRDIMVLMNSKQYNGGASFDPASGVFRGTVDSTD